MIKKNSSKSKNLPVRVFKKTKNRPMLIDTVEMGENKMGPKILGSYCKKGENLK
jgi:hypothetical protein